MLSGNLYLCLFLETQPLYGNCALSKRGVFSVFAYIDVAICMRGRAVMTVCELIYERERNTLSEFAFLTENTRGRDYPIRRS